MIEIRQKYDYRAKPSIKNKAAKKATKEGKTLSSKIEELLSDYSLGNSVTLKEAIKILCKELKKDKTYFYSWQANIAMSFYDAYNSESGNKNKETIHKIANEAAINFLNNLIN